MGGESSGQPGASPTVIALGMHPWERMAAQSEEENRQADAAAAATAERVQRFIDAMANVDGNDAEDDDDSVGSPPPLEEIGSHEGDNAPDDPDQAPGNHDSDQDDWPPLNELLALDSPDEFEQGQTW